MSDERLSFCRICAAACGIVVTVEPGPTQAHPARVVEVRGDRDHPVSHGYTCAKGRALARHHHHPDRLDRPLLGGRPVPWGDLLDDLGSALGGLARTRGPDAVGMYLATGLGFDAAGQIGAMGWFAGLGSSQLYTAVTVDNAPALVVAELVAGHQLANPVWDPLVGGTLLIVGANPVVSHGYGTALPDPVAHLRTHREQGGRTWVLDPRATETAAHADRHLAVRPGADTVLLAHLARRALASAVDAPPPGTSPDDLARLETALAPFTLELAASVAGIDPDDVAELADEVVASTGRLAVMCGTGVMMSADGVLAEWLRWVLLALTGSLDTPSGMRFNTGIVSRLRPPRRPRPAGPGPRSRPELGRVAGQVPCVALADEIEAGTLAGLVVAGGNPLAAFPEPDRLAAALARLEVLAVVDVAANELTDLATHVLPATGQLERADATLGEGVAIRSGMQFTPAVVPAVAERRPAWWMFARLAAAAGGDLCGGNDPDDLDDEGFLAGVVGDEVRAAGPRGLGVPHRYGWVRDRLLDGGPWRLAPGALLDRLAAHRPPGNGLVLTPRRDPSRLNSVDYGGRARPAVIAHPDTLAGAGVAEGDEVTLASDHGAVAAVVVADPAVRPGVVSVNHGRSTTAPGRLVSARRAVDPLTGMPRASGVVVELTAQPPGAQIGTQPPPVSS